MAAFSPVKKTASFHPAVDRWFRKHFAAPTEPQAGRLAGRFRPAAMSWSRRRPGPAKTLAAFLAAIDSLVRRGVETPLPDETLVVYVSPLKALSNDIQKNLSLPLAGIREELKALDLPDVEIRTLVRTGDTPQAERAGMRKRPPHIVVTTPESLYVLLGSESGRKMLATTRTVIVDEIHALAGNKRGSHLALSLERLAALTPQPPARIGLSATQKPIEEIARFLVGATSPRAASATIASIVDAGHIRARDLAIEVPSSPLEAVMSNEVWQQVYGRLADLALAHQNDADLRQHAAHGRARRPPPVRAARRRARHRAPRQHGEGAAAQSRAAFEARRAESTGRHRFARARHRYRRRRAGLPARLAAIDRDLPAARGARRATRSAACPRRAFFRCRGTSWSNARRCSTRSRRGELDRLIIPPKPLDVLSQQIVAEVAARSGREDALFELVRRAYPYATLTRDEFLDVVRTLAEGFSTRRGHRAAYVHRDAVNGVLRGRRGARLTALTSGGAIPDNADYEVVLEPAGQIVGTVNEDFAVESLAGDIFQLGNSSYRISARSKPVACGSTTRTGSRRRFRSGWARRPRAPPSSRTRCRVCARTLPGG